MKIGIMAKRYNQKKLRKKKFKTRTLLHTYVHEFQGERRIDHPLKSHTR